MKATLTFNLPEEREEFEAASKGMATRAALQFLDNKMRGIIKYREVSEETRDVVQELRNHLNAEAGDLL